MASEDGPSGLTIGCLIARYPQCREKPNGFEVGWGRDLCQAGGIGYRIAFCGRCAAIDVHACQCDAAQPGCG